MDNLNDSDTKPGIQIDFDTRKFKQLLEEMVGNAGPDTIIMADPQLIEKLEKENSDIITRIPRKPIKEILIDTFDNRRVKALEIIDKIPSVLDNTRPSIQQLYDEIKECILFGVNGAAITLCGILVEYVLKYVTYHWDIQERSVVFDPEKWDHIVEKTQLGGAITNAHLLGIICADETKTLTTFKDEVRNPYSHYNIRKLVKDFSLLHPRIDAIKETLENVETIASEDPAFFPYVKKYRDDMFLSHIFRDTYHNSKVLLTRLDTRWKIKNKL
ncbi:MAG: hypothetical protein ACYDEQ_15100 [Desulfocucumaceae bacterium]